MSKKFQFTPLREGRLEALDEIITDLQFQFTPLREGRRSPYRHIVSLLGFNSRPCVRGDPASGTYPRE